MFLVLYRVTNHMAGAPPLTERNWYIYMAQPWAPPPPPPGMVMVPCPAPCGSGWGGCGWVAMLVDGVVVFANDVESYGICKGTRLSAGTKASLEGT